MVMLGLLYVPAMYVVFQAVLSMHAFSHMTGIVRCHVMLCHVMSCHVMSCHVMSCHVMSCHVMSCHVMSCHVMSLRVVSCRVMLCLAMSCDVMSRHVTSCVCVSCPVCVTSRHVTSRHVMCSLHVDSSIFRSLSPGFLHWCARLLWSEPTLFCAAATCPRVVHAMCTHTTPCGVARPHLRLRTSGFLEVLGLLTSALPSLTRERHLARYSDRPPCKPVKV